MEPANLIRQLEAAAESLSNDFAQAGTLRDADRSRLLSAARSIISVVEGPEDAVMNIAKAVGWSKRLLPRCLRSNCIREVASRAGCFQSGSEDENL